MPRAISFFLALTLLTACQPIGIAPTPSQLPPEEATVPVTPAANPYAPQPNDANFLRAEVHLTSLDLITLESLPTQIGLLISGSLPSPCHALRVTIQLPNQQNQISVEVYSVVNTAQTCGQALKQFEATVPLGIYPPGSYTVWVNGIRVGNFSS